MTEDDAAYVRDLIHTARGHYEQAIGLLDEAARIAGGETRDQPAVGFRWPPDLIAALARTPNPTP